MNSEKTEIRDALTRRPGERYFSYIKRCKQNKEACDIKLFELKLEIIHYSHNLEEYWSDLCRAAKAYGILIGKWRDSKR